MSEPILSFERQFQLWTYTVGHGQLLLRSPKAPGHPERIDVLFKDVTWINLPTLLHGLHVEVAEGEAARERLAAAGVRETGTGRLYLLRGRDWRGHVLAGAVFHHVDEGEYYAPSALLPDFPP